MARKTPETKHIYFPSVDMDRYDSSVQYLLQFFREPELATVAALDFYRRYLEQITAITIKIYPTNGRSQADWESLSSSKTLGITYTTAAELFEVSYRDKPWLAIQLKIDEIKGKSPQEIRSIFEQKLAEVVKDQAKREGILSSLWGMLKK